VREKRADGRDCQGQKIGQKKGPHSMDVDVAEESPSPGDGQQRVIFGTETKNTRSHLVTRLVRGFGVGGDP